MRVTPRASRDRIEVGDPVKVYVTASPTENQANEAVVRVIAAHLDVAKGRVSVLRGMKSRNKVVLIEGLDFQEILKRLGQ